MLAIAGIVSAAVSKTANDSDVFIGYGQLRIAYLVFVSAGFLVQLSFLAFEVRYVPYGSPFTRNIVMISIVIQI